MSKSKKQTTIKLDQETMTAHINKDDFQRAVIDALTTTQVTDHPQHPDIPQVSPPILHDAILSAIENDPVIREHIKAIINNTLTDAIGNGQLTPGPHYMGGF